jgi:hypothetical protein
MVTPLGDAAIESNSVHQLDVDDGQGDEQWELPGPSHALGAVRAIKVVDVSIHLWCGAAFWAGAATTSRRKFLMMRWEVMSQEPPNMT